MIVIILVILLILLTRIDGGSETSIYYLDCVRGDDVINYMMPEFCESAPVRHYSLNLPKYENAEKHSEYYTVMRRGLARFILPVMPVFSDFLTAYWFLTTNKVNEVIMLDSYAGVIQQLLIKFFKVKIHYFTPKKVPAISGVIHYQRLPEAGDFKKLSGLPLINLNFYLYKVFTPESFINGCLFTNTYAAHLLENFKSRLAISGLVSVRYNIFFEIPRGNLMIMPFRPCSSNQKFLHYYTGAPGKMTLDLLKINGSLCVFDFCVRLKSHGNYSPVTWDAWQFRQIADKNAAKICKFMGPVPQKPFNSPAGMEHPKVRDPERFLDKIPQDLNLQNSYVSAFCDDIEIKFSSIRLEDYDFFHETTEAGIIIVNENGYKTILNAVNGMKLKYLIPTYSSNLYAALMFSGSIWSPQPITEYITKYVNNTNYYSFNVGTIKNPDINFIKWKVTAAAKKVIKQGTERLIKHKLQNVQRIWLEKNDAVDIIVEMLHGAYPEAIILVVGPTAVEYDFVVNYPIIKGIIKPETGDVIWKIQ